MEEGLLPNIFYVRARMALSVVRDNITTILLIHGTETTSTSHFEQICHAGLADAVRVVNVSAFAKASLNEVWP